MGKTLTIDYRCLDTAELDVDYLFDEIQAQYEPEDVFTWEQLKKWANDSGFYEEKTERKTVNA
jgi:hypothetical protein